MLLIGPWHYFLNSLCINFTLIFVLCYIFTHKCSKHLSFPTFQSILHLMTLLLFFLYFTNYKISLHCLTIQELTTYLHVIKIRSNCTISKLSVDFYAHSTFWLTVTYWGFALYLCHICLLPCIFVCKLNLASWLKVNWNFHFCYSCYFRHFQVIVSLLVFLPWCCEPRFLEPRTMTVDTNVLFVLPYLKEISFQMYILQNLRRSWSKLISLPASHCREKLTEGVAIQASTSAVSTSPNKALPVEIHQDKYSSIQ